MSRLLIVRHAQASAGSGDYDQLSELGYRQARALGEQWAIESLVPDSVYVGPCKRHRQTCETLAAAAGRGSVEWPAPVEIDEMDEHDGFVVVRYFTPQLAERDPWVAAEAERARAGGDDALRSYFALYRHVTRKWALGELDLDGTDFEPWPDFRRRVESGLGRILESEGRGRTVALFTSSGPSAVAVGHALGVGDERMIELSWVVRNVGVSELLFTEERLSLGSFNSLPRLEEPGLATLV